MAVWKTVRTLREKSSCNAVAFSTEYARHRMRHRMHCPSSVYDAPAPAVAPPAVRAGRALLIFADAQSLDLERRRLPGGFATLLRTPSSTACLAPGVDRHLFTAHRFMRSRTSAAPAEAFTVHAQQGKTFGEKLEAAIESVAALGYAEVVVIGADCPQLDAADVATAFEQLTEHALVLGPDEHGGCYLIGLRLSERARLRGVRWQRNTDCQQLAANFGSARTFLLPVKLDLDTLADVRLLARSADRWAALARTLLAALDTRGRSTAVPARFILALHRLRARWQLPPPCVGAS